jgi:hypothetical protein
LAFEVKIVAGLNEREILSFAVNLWKALGKPHQNDQRLNELAVFKRLTVLL